MSDHHFSIAGSEDWLGKLNKTICTLGRAAFEDSLFDLVNAAVRVDHCAVFITNHDGTAGHLFTKSKLDEETCIALAKAYTDDFHSRDPNLASLSHDVTSSHEAQITLLPHTPTTDYDEAYRDQFFTDTGLIDKMSSLLQTRQYAIYCSFYRLAPTGRFQDREIEDLSHILPILTNLIFKHSRLAGLKEKQQETENNPDPIITQVPLGRSPDAMAYLLDAKNEVFAQLTDRERQVCTRILQGYTSEAISLELKVAKSTIHTYRKRAYAKLGISSQNELFSLCLEFMPVGQPITG